MQPLVYPRKRRLFLEISLDGAIHITQFCYDRRQADAITSLFPQQCVQYQTVKDEIIKKKDSTEFLVTQINILIALNIYFLKMSVFGLGRAKEAQSASLMPAAIGK